MHNFCNYPHCKIHNSFSNLVTGPSYPAGPSNPRIRYMFVGSITYKQQQWFLCKVSVTGFLSTLLYFVILCYENNLLEKEGYNGNNQEAG